MIDIHTHILSNVDDGAVNMADSLQALQSAEKAGFTDIILTPHYIPDYYENTVDELEEKINNLREQTYKGNIIINIHKGNEIYICEDLVELVKNNQLYTLAGSRYVLFELPLNHKLFITNNVITELIANDYIPILAHPERYEFVQENPNVLIDLINSGVLIQANYASITGRYGKTAQKTVMKMLKHKMVHFLGTDTHRKGSLYEDFDSILTELSKVLSQEEINNLTTNNANCILEDMEIKIEEPIPIKKRRWLFWK